MVSNQSIVNYKIKLLLKVNPPFSHILH